MATYLSTWISSLCRLFWHFSSLFIKFFFCPLYQKTLAAALKVCRIDLGFDAFILTRVPKTSFDTSPHLVVHSSSAAFSSFVSRLKVKLWASLSVEYFVSRDSDSNVSFSAVAPVAELFISWTVAASFDAKSMIWMIFHARPSAVSGSMVSSVTVK
jgi:hypothetical protein